MDIFVGSLPFKLKENELRELFEPYGEVGSVKIVIDKITRQNKGFGFVEMPNDNEAKLAIETLNGSELQGRTLVVNKSEKKVKTDRNSPSGRGAYKSGGYSKEGEGRRDSQNRERSSYRDSDRTRGGDFKKGGYTKPAGPAKSEDSSEDLPDDDLKPSRFKKGDSKKKDFGFGSTGFEYFKNPTKGRRESFRKDKDKGKPGGFKKDSKKRGRGKGEDDYEW